MGNCVVLYVLCSVQCASFFRHLQFCSLIVLSHDLHLAEHLRLLKPLFLMHSPSSLRFPNRALAGGVLAASAALFYAYRVYLSEHQRKEKKKSRREQKKVSFYWFFVGFHFCLSVESQSAETRQNINAKAHNSNNNRINNATNNTTRR